MKRTCGLFCAVILIGIGSSVVAQDAPRGASATGCDVAQFTPVLSERTGAVLYWNNRTCPAGSGPTDSPDKKAPWRPGDGRPPFAGGGEGDDWTPGDGPPPWAGPPGGGGQGGGRGAS